MIQTNKQIKLHMTCITFPFLGLSENSVLLFPWDTAIRIIYKKIFCTTFLYAKKYFQPIFARFQTITIPSESDEASKFSP